MSSQHAAFAQTQEENWTVIDDAQKRKRVQNRLAQRSYRHKVRKRLEELDQLKTAEQGSTRASTQASTQASTHVSTQALTQAPTAWADLLDCNAAAQVKAAPTASTVRPPAFSSLSESSESSELSESSEFGQLAQFIPGFSELPFSSLASPDKGGEEESSIEDFFAGFCSSDSTEADALSRSAVGGSQPWTAPPSEPADYGFELFGPLIPFAAHTQKAELRFTELMLKIRDVGFVDMESMILEYYSTQFSRESLPYWLQRRSRQQNLSKLLEQLYTDSCTWPAEECASFQEGIQRIADHGLHTEHPSSDALLSFPFPIDNGVA